MTLYEFKFLSEEQQADTLWDKGVFLCHRKQGGQYIALYQIEAFYVEVYFNGEAKRYYQA